MTSKAGIVRLHVHIDEEAKTWTCNQCVADNEKLGKEVQPVKVYSYSGGTSNIVRHFSEFHQDTFNTTADAVKEMPVHTPLIREYYDLVGENTYSCSLCQKKVKSVRTSNLLYHFRKYHETAYNEYVKVSYRKKLKKGGSKRRYTDTGSELEYSGRGKSVKEDASEIADFEWAETEEADQGVDSEYIEDNTRVIQMNESDYQSPVVDDPLKMFFNAMYASVKRLPKGNVFQIRRRIFELVSEAEEMAFQNEVSSKEETVE